ncbi:hypothetical protein AN7057.2 [Aspergillus nidulans FGSC A4]|uniref:Uncharacterized protein n=1 Tax=Emericella nidulans (strain FGSC A4 / ATCC 38163 / CBS 112.46 / NRRL 194 / M139) TaxID=227321 RepID=Q5AXC3_EMENI|nr:hypothetical protein [Aspergillus nidulans FGSC A4]EAA61703.1 hypothetical protein AN7057.2 [Aspergillus nidulans FGSC A4]CBF79173.1 TPA: hypothetical protein ANIA_07057 [Aspergillus nidulans FGSC A4]|eukprot:XP_664661.1 hypothetical protein AN7057.2 [Aspergillus nidulans FGSC A4]
MRTTKTTADTINGLLDKTASSTLRRLDLGFLTIGFLGYVFKYLDQINISNAYVSGMQDNLKLYSNELGYFTTYFNISTTNQVLWNVFTCCLSTVTNEKQGVCTIFVALIAFVLLPRYFGYPPDMERLDGHGPPHLVNYEVFVTFIRPYEAGTLPILRTKTSEL